MGCSVQPMFIEAGPQLSPRLVMALAAYLLPGFATLSIFDLAAIGGGQMGQQALLAYPPLFVLAGGLCLLACGATHRISGLVALCAFLGLSQES